jgi:hypothetical protein
VPLRIIQEPPSRIQGDGRGRLFPNGSAAALLVIWGFRDSNRAGRVSGPNERVQAQVPIAQNVVQNVNPYCVRFDNVCFASTRSRQTCHVIEDRATAKAARAALSGALPMRPHRENGLSALSQSRRLAGEQPVMPRFGGAPAGRSNGCSQDSSRCARARPQGHAGFAVRCTQPSAAAGERPKFLPLGLPIALPP